MPQINITVDDRMAAAVDRIASKKGLSRPDLIRWMIDETENADAEDRLAFARADTPKLDVSVSALVQHVRESVVELDRSLRETQKVNKRALEAWNGGEEAVLEAQHRQSELINARFRDGFDPFRDLVAKVLTEVIALPELVQAGLAEQVSEIAKQLVQVHTLAAQPRTANYLYLSSKRRIALGLLALTHMALLIGGFGSGVYLMDSAQQVSAPPDQRMVKTPAAACRMVNQVFTTSDCRVPEPERKRAVVALHHESQP